MDVTLAAKSVQFPCAADDATGPSRRSWWLWLTLATFLALVVRTAPIAQHSVWYDEAFTSAISQNSYGELLSGAARDNGNPPLYFVLIRFYASVFGRSEIALRSLSVILGAITVPLLGLLGRRLLDARAGLLAAALMAISPYAVEMSNEARTYALLGVLAVLDNLLFVRWMDRPRPLGLIACSITTFLSCYSHYYAFALPIIHGIILLIRAETRRLLVPWLAGMVFAGLLWLPWLPSFLDQLRTPGNLGRLADRWPLQFAATPVVLSLGRTLAWRDSQRWVLAAAMLGTLVTFGWPLLQGLRRRRKWPHPNTLLVLWLLVPIVGPLVVALLLSPLYQTRYAYFCIPALLLLVASGLQTFRPTLRTALIAGIILLTGISLYRYSTETLKDDWRSATPYVLSRVHDAEPILFDTDSEITSLKYYVPRFGAMPENMFGLMTPPRDENAPLQAVQWINGQRADSLSRDHAPDILSAPRVCLVLCVPNGSPELYRSYFEKHGYHATEHEHFQRIDVLGFAK
jgi:uncharacterized membrane protein